MSSNQETPSSTDQQVVVNDTVTTSQSHSQDQLSVQEEEIQEIDVAQADESDSWETDDEGDFYNEESNGRLVDREEDSLLDFGLSKNLIECYPMATAEEVSIVGVVCDICLNEYKSSDKVRTIPCLHRFHTKCIDKWLKKSSKCPMCRSDLRKSKWYSS